MGEERQVSKEKPLQILIVEDDRDIRELLLDLLSEEGYTAITAANGIEALKILESKTPSLILTDLMMPTMNGWDFINYMDKNNICVGVPTYAITADGVNAGFKRAVIFIKKPMQVTDILSVCIKHCTGEKAWNGFQ